MTPLRVELLGGLRVLVGNTPVTRFRTQKAAALLAYLALHPGRHFGREELALLLWPDADDERARVSLRTALSHLRDAVGEDALRRDGNRSVGLADAHTDVHAFEQAVAQKRWGDARALYRGELLPGFWDEWILAERERLAALRERVPEGDVAAPSPARLPVPSTDRLWGRDAELAQAVEDLDATRILTFLGPGGVGKSRLALAVAQRVARDFPGGLWFVPLAALRDGRRIPAAVRDALEIAPDPKRPPLDQVAEYLAGDAPCLLVLDNLEQLAPYAAAELRALLERVPNLRLLATSRRRLGIPGERQRTVGPLDDDGAARLFVERARAVSDQPLPDADVRALCRELDALPLALELAAARCATLSVAQIRRRLAERFALLTDGGAEKGERHRSLHAALDWSVGLLTPEQRDVFLGVAVFRGGWTTEGAEAVCGTPMAAEYLAQLRERSLVQLGTGGRWSLLETLRHFALAQPEDRSDSVRRHVDHCVALARAGDAAVLRAEADNLRAALERADPARHTDLALALVPHWFTMGGADDAVPALERVTREGTAPARLEAWICLADFWEQRGDAHAMREVARQAMRVAHSLHDPAAMVRARLCCAYAHTVLRRHETALRLARAALDAYPAPEDARTLQRAHATLGIGYFFRDDFDAAAEEFGKGLALSLATGNAVAIAQAHANVGIVRMEQGRYAEAREHVGAALDVARAGGMTFHVATHASTLAWIDYYEGDWEASARRNAEAIRHAAAHSARLILRNSLWVRGCLDVQTGRPDRAPLLWGVAARLSDEIGTPMVPDDLARQEALAFRVATVVGEATLERALARGAAMPLEEAVALALGDEG